jgi:hypothetical protein
MSWMPPLGMGIGIGWERRWRRRRGFAAAACAAFILSIGVQGPADAASLCTSAAIGRRGASSFPSPLPLPLMIPLRLRGGGGSGSGRRSRGRGKGGGSSSAPPSSLGMASEEAVEESSATARRKRDRKGAKIRHKAQQADDKEGEQVEEGEQLAPEAQSRKDELQSEIQEWGLGPEDSTEMLEAVVTPTLAEEGRRVAFTEPSPMTVDPTRRKFTVRLHCKKIHCRSFLSPSPSPFPPLPLSSSSSTSPLQSQAVILILLHRHAGIHSREGV